MSKDSFRAFVRNNPNFIYSVRDKKVTWQELYELYDLYGEDKSVFNKYLESSSNNSSSRGSSKSAFNDISNMIKELDVDKVQNGVTSLQNYLLVKREQVIMVVIIMNLGLFIRGLRINEYRCANGY